MNKRDGGMAFPRQFSDRGPNENATQAQSGMSRRQWLVGMALQGMLAHATRYKPREYSSQNWHQAIAEEAHEIADAVLAYEEEENGKE